MLVIPAIHLKQGECLEGKIASEGMLASHGLEDVAGRWFDRGFTCLQLIDMDGITDKEINFNLIQNLAFRFPNLTLQVSACISSQAEIETYCKAGIAPVVVELFGGLENTCETDSINMRHSPNSEMVEKWMKLAELFPRKLYFKINASSGSQVMDAVNLANRFSQASLAGFIFSPKVEGGDALDIDALSKFASLVTQPVYASGQLEDMDDVRALVAESGRGIAGVIVENAQINEGLNLLEAQAYCNEFKD